MAREVQSDARWLSALRRAAAAEQNLCELKKQKQPPQPPFSFRGEKKDFFYATHVDVCVPSSSSRVNYENILRGEQHWAERGKWWVFRYFSFWCLLSRARARLFLWYWFWAYAPRVMFVPMFYCASTYRAGHICCSFIIHFYVCVCVFIQNKYIECLLWDDEMMMRLRHRRRRCRLLVFASVAFEILIRCRQMLKWWWNSECVNVICICICAQI